MDCTPQLWSFQVSRSEGVISKPRHMRGFNDCIGDNYRISATGRLHMRGLSAVRCLKIKILVSKIHVSLITATYLSVTERFGVVKDC